MAQWIPIALPHGERPRECPVCRASVRTVSASRLCRLTTRSGSGCRAHAPDDGDGRYRAMIDRMSFNQITLDPWSLEHCVRECEQLGIPFIAAWRHKLKNCKESARLIRNAGLRLSSLCRGGWF